jgi:hypothetical protein
LSFRLPAGPSNEPTARLIYFGKLHREKRSQKNSREAKRRMVLTGPFERGKFQRQFLQALPLLDRHRGKFEAQRVARQIEEMAFSSTGGRIVGIRHVSVQLDLLGLSTSADCIQR